MNPSWKRALTILLLTVTVIVAGLMVAAWSMLPLDRTAVTIEGETFSLADLTGTDAIVFFVIAVAAVVFAVMVAIAAGAFGLGVGALGLALGLAITLAALAFVASPFIVFAWLAWRALRHRPVAPRIVST